MAVLPVGKILSVAADELKVASYGFKHVAPSKMAWKEVVKMTKNGPAKFIHGTDVEKLTKTAWDLGENVTNGKPWKVFEAKGVLGASAGKETKYMRVELTVSTGELHGSPITEAQYNKLLKGK